MKREDLAHWYLRLNGVFTITNFVVHPTHKGSQLTDGDIVGVRLPHRSEFQQGPGADQDLFVHERTRPYFILAEIKRGLSELNQSWRQPPHQPVLEMLQDLGPFRKIDLEKAASHLVTTGFYETDAMYASLFFIGTSFTPDLPSHAPRKTWDDLIRFIHRRLARTTISRPTMSNGTNWERISGNIS